MKARRPRIENYISAEVKQMRDFDRLFFERFPHRQHRLRRLAQAEIEQLEETFRGEFVIGDPAATLFVLVKNLAPGVRLRVHIPGPAGETGDDAAEDMVAALWKAKAARNPFLRHQAAALQKAMRLPGGPLHEGGAL